ncbi:MAG: sulfate reduction electron transfer complex DsrMKJOP subunit DsrJ [Acidobacteriota bacterium]
MRDRVWIIAGLFLFLGLVTYPVWHNLVAHTSPKPPQLVLPANEKQCVAPVNYMRSSHMKLLLQWRQEVVREDKSKYVAFNGKVYNMSLSGTCLKCHNQQEFCVRCHTYAGVRTPYCWNCHLDPAQVKRSAR